MATVTVKHLNDKAFREMNCIFNEDKRVEFAKEALKNRDYKTVASLELGGARSSIFNEAYFQTNSVDRAWYDNPDILVDEVTRQGCRSTSVGDLFELAGELYMVAGCGFKYLGDC